MAAKYHLLCMLAAIVIAGGCINQSTAAASAKCDLFKNPDKRDWCLIDMAMTSKNLPVCDLISGQKWKSECYGSVLLNLTYCDNMTEIHWRDACYYNVAVGLKNTSICPRIRDMNYRTGCFGDASPITAAKSPCERLEDMNMTLWCYAKEMQNPTLCVHITDDFWRRRCYDDTNYTFPTTTTSTVKTTTTASTSTTAEPATTSSTATTTSTSTSETLPLQTSTTLSVTSTTEASTSTTTTMESTSTTTATTTSSTTTSTEAAPPTTLELQMMSCQDYCKTLGAGYTGTGGCLFDSAAEGDCRGLNSAVPRWKAVFKGQDPSFFPYSCPTEAWCCCMETIK